jgi:DNA-binding beta-propeller fold protein YncE
VVRIGHRALGPAALALGLAVLLWMASSARADILYWSNYQGASLGFSNPDGTGGGAVNAGSAEVNSSEGLTIDTAGGTLIWTNVEGGPDDKGGIFFTKLDGSGSGRINTGAANVSDPNAIAIDPATRTVYWSNYSGGPGDKGTISFAKLDGSAAGDLNVTGAVLDSPEAIAIDTSGGRIYWGNSANDAIYFANLNGSGGAPFNASGAPSVETPGGMAIDPNSGRLYWSNATSNKISFANLSGGGGGELPVTGVALDEPYGLALDPVAGRLYVGNYGVGEKRSEAFISLALSGGGSYIGIASAPVSGPQNPVILRAPSGTSVPKVTGKAKFNSKLTCSTGAWASDLAGSYLYQGPTTYAYQWARNGKAVKGATASTLKVKSAGKFVCKVTASNQAGSAVQSSKVKKVEKAKFQAKVKTPKVKAAPGGAGLFKLAITNKGGMPASAKVCVEAQKKAKSALKTPKCASLGKVNAGKKKSARLRVKVKPGAAAGAYKLKFKVKGGSGGKAASAKLIVG